MIFDGRSLLYHSSPIRYRYRFAVDSDGKVLEEIKDMMYIYRPPAWINLTKTVYTYHPTRIDELLSENFLTVSPNPVQGGQVRIALREADSKIELVELYDLYGRIILNQKIDNQQIIDFNFPDIQNGHYLLKVKTDKGAIVKKVFFLN